ncbi:hypothetical protein CapIbe_011248 [Capra ibex]
MNCILIVAGSWVLSQETFPPIFKRKILFFKNDWIFILANRTLQHSTPSQPACSQEPKNMDIVMKLLSEDVEGAKEEGCK